MGCHINIPDTILKSSWKNSFAFTICQAFPFNVSSPIKKKSATNITPLKNKIKSTQHHDANAQSHILYNMQLPLIVKCMNACNYVTLNCVVCPLYLWQVYEKRFYENLFIMRGYFVHGFSIISGALNVCNLLNLLWCATANKSINDDVQHL